jgi:thioesterase domain-containing protein
MASLYLREMRTVQPQGPYLRAGWSMGGLVALELARQLEDLGQQAAMLFMFDTHLSGTDRAVGALDDASVMRWIAPHVDIPPEQLRALPPERQWEVISEQANLSDGIGAIELRRLAEVCKAHLRAHRQYKPKPHSGPAVLFLADTPERKQEVQWDSICPHLRLEHTPGDHYSMLRQPNVDALARRVGFYLPRGSDGL